MTEEVKAIEDKKQRLLRKRELGISLKKNLSEDELLRLPYYVLKTNIDIITQTIKQQTI